MATILLADVLTLDLVEGYYKKIGLGKTTEAFAEDAESGKRVDPIGAFLMATRDIAFDRLMRYEGNGIDDLVTDFGFDYDEVDGFVDAIGGDGELDTKDAYQRGYKIGTTLAEAFDNAGD